MKKELLFKILPHIVAPILFILAAYIYFSPLIEGKGLAQHDVVQWKGQAKEIHDHRAATGEETLWTNTMFGGMPSYLISVQFRTNLLKFADRIIQLGARPASYIFATLLGFYILLLVLGVSPWLSIVGAFAYGLSSYFFIIIGAGHNAKIHAISYVAPMIAGMILTYKGKLFGGFALFALFFGLNLYTGHPQITYYAGFVMIALTIVYFYQAYKEKLLVQFVKAIGVLAIAGILAFGANFSKLWFTYDYGKDSIRGKSELTSNKDDKTSGLDKGYAMQWSYGIAETFNIMIPNLMGGASSGELGSDSKTYEFLKQNGVSTKQAEQIVSQLPTYWGPQPVTSGPVYIGAIVVFLFLFGLFAVKGIEKWALFGVTVLSIALAMGHNFLWLSNIFLDYFPGYNKFRTVSMILYIAEITMPLLGFIALKKVFDGSLNEKQFYFSLKWSVGITAGISIIFLLFGGAIFSFSGEIDGQLLSSGWPKQLLDAFKEDRKEMLKADSLRSLIYILLAAGALFAFFIKKLKAHYFIVILGLLIVADMWVVNKRYMNNDNFVAERKVENPFTPTAADLQILEDKTLNYRVFNLTVSPFNDGSTSYFHKSLGGYHGAKMRRYQELIDEHISKGNIAVLNMLNTRYIIQQGESGPIAQFNPGALGNAWFVDTVQIVADADEEINSLNNFDPFSKAFVDQRFAKHLEGVSPLNDSLGTIQLIDYKPNKLVYKSETQSQKVAVFSEIYYQKGWKVTVDGKPHDHFRANYVLRAMVIPEGSHEIVFSFEPKMFEIGKNIDLASSLLILLAFFGWVGFELKRKFFN
ncbi:MAG: YfhO family protein [Tenuifilaceae bacterium]